MRKFGKYLILKKTLPVAAPSIGFESNNWDFIVIHISETYKFTSLRKIFQITKPFCARFIGKTISFDGLILGKITGNGQVPTSQLNRGLT